MRNLFLSREINDKSILVWHINEKPSLVAGNQWEIYSFYGKSMRSLLLCGKLMRYLVLSQEIDDKSIPVTKTQLMRNLSLHRRLMSNLFRSQEINEKSILILQEIKEQDHQFHNMNVLFRISSWIPLGITCEDYSLRLELTVDIKRGLSNCSRWHLPLMLRSRLFLHVRKDQWIIYPWQELMSSTRTKCAMCNVSIGL